MNKENESKAPDILPVPRTKEEAKRSYDRISRYYDYLTGAFEEWPDWAETVDPYSGPKRRKDDEG